MHRDVDGARQHVGLDLAGEKPLAADLLEGAVDDLVAGGLDHDDGEGLVRQIEGGGQPVARLVRLGQGQGRSAGADLQRLGGGG